METRTMHLRILPLIVALISSLQSYRVAFAADVACGSTAVFGPAPLVAARATSNPLSVTRLNPDSLKLFRVHGNADNTCDDAYTVTLPPGSTDIILQTELTSFKGSEFYKVCSSDAGYATVCSVPRLIPFFNPRQGAWKDSMLGTSPVPVWSAPSATVGATFALTIHGGTQSYTTLVASGYEFWIGVSSERLCNPPTRTFGWSQVTMTANSLTVTAPALAAGVYTLCMAVVKDGDIVSDYFPLSATLGHSIHNLKIGVPNTDVAWELRPINGDQLQYESAQLSQVRLFVEKSVTTDGWTNFGIDTSADICSPLLRSSFDSSELLVFNATHLYVDTVVPRPYGNPGGGRAVLCGARGATSPWTLLSTSQYWPWVYACPPGYGVLLPTDSNPCYSCPPNVQTPCNNNGNCGTFESKTIVRSSATCVCFPRYYTSTCASYDLYPPAVSPKGGLYKTRHLTVTIVKPPTADLAVVLFNDGSQLTCTGTCYLTLSSYTKFKAKSTSVNQSQSLDQTWYTYQFAAPTETPTLTVSNSPSRELTETASQAPDDAIPRLSPSQSAVVPFRATVSQRSLSIDQHTRSVSEPHTKTHRGKKTTQTTTSSVRYSVASISLVTVTNPLPTEEDRSQSFTAERDVPEQISFFVELTPASNYTAQIPQHKEFKQLLCEWGSCTTGIEFSCGDLSVRALYVAPTTRHSCNASFRSSSVALSYAWEVRVIPVPVGRGNVLFNSNPRVATIYRYRAATIPYLVSTEVAELQSCGGGEWVRQTIHLRDQLGCVVAKATAAGFSTAFSTVRDTPMRALAAAGRETQNLFGASAFVAEFGALVPVSPGGVFLGCATGILTVLLILSFTL